LILRGLSDSIAFRTEHPGATPSSWTVLAGFRSAMAGRSWSAPRPRSTRTTVFWSWTESPACSSPAPPTPRSGSSPGSRGASRMSTSAARRCSA